MDQFVDMDWKNVHPLSQELADAALKRRAHVVYVHCFDEETKQGMTFTAIAPFLPQAGNLLRLENGEQCVVIGVEFKVNRTTEDQFGNEHCFLQPHVAAKLLTRNACSPAGS